MLTGSGLPPRSEVVLKVDSRQLRIEEINEKVKVHRRADRSDIAGGPIGSDFSG